MIERAMLCLSLLVLVTGCEEAADCDLLSGDLCLEEAENALSGIYFVELDPETSDIANFAQNLSESLNFDLLHVYESAAAGFSMRVPHVLVEEIAKIAGVRDVIEDDEEQYAPNPEPDEEFDNEDREPELIPEIVEDPAVQYGEYEVPEGIVRIGGPYMGGLLLEEVHVAVIDTGVDGDHPDLNVVAHFDAVGASNPDDAHPGDPDGHGTHVAGTIGARADQEGVAGVAPGVAIHSVRVLGSDGSGYDSDIIAGLEYVLDHPEIRVVNMSLGGPSGGGLEGPFQEAVARLVDSGVVVVIAAGNESVDTEGVVPAGFNEGVVVSAYSVKEEEYAFFSNYGTAVDVSAPGTSIYSTYPASSFVALDGTSMAAPHVAGAAALYAAQSQNPTNQVFLEELLSNGETSYPGQGGSHPEPFLNISHLLP